MDPHVVAAVQGLGGVAASSQLVRRGISTRQVARAVRAGDLVRVRRDALVLGELWRQAKPWERHALRARAVVAGSHPDRPVVLTHHSALALWGIALHGVDDRVHLTTPSGRRGRSDGVVSSHRAVPPPFVTRREGIRLVTPAAACVQVAAVFGVEAGLVSADDALHRGHVVASDLALAAAALGVSRSSRSPAAVVALADPRVESAAESRARWVFHVLGIEQPTPQVEVYDEDGRFVGRVDFMLRGLRVVVEVDGMSKYTDPTDLRAEKRREDRLRELGYEVVRLTWADLRDPQVVLRKLTAAMARARTRST
ncbi:DUF559 domain-containing protein [Janibacter melonis]|uniref:type IV toxin-antitoxin system AbiEi family antitoxin domain-containing protein n=1 Tax=Janibacter melonis TaxID=262209 RepID=UPI0020436A51|nr:type IV toxin-antitoxin system AbiEi family antitoxin domain-containing protein [Janibacter melonis]MCM3556808.1 DUF559 domain-containing protein [Janibacter melonis]